MTSLNGSPEDRLRAVDPAAGAVYAHADMAGALARITATPRVAKVRFADGFRLKMGSAAAAAALVTAGGIAALGAAAPSLSVLALGASHHLGVAANVPSSTAIGGDMMRIWGSDHFIAGPGLSSGSSSAPTYLITPPSDLSAASEQIAAALSITGTPSDTPSVDNSWTIGPDANQVSFYVSQGMLNWNYVLTSPEVTPVTPGSTSSSGSGDAGATDTTVPDTTSTTVDPSTYPTLSNDQALADTQSYLSALGISDQVGDPVFSTYPDDVNQVNQTTVQFAWVVNGLDTGSSFWFTFDPSGNLLYANGQIATISSGPIYPLLSETDAVAALQKQQDQYSGPIYAPVTSPSNTDPTTNSDVTTTTTADGSVASTTDTVPSTDSTDTVPDTVPTPPVRDVTLVSATLQYQIYTLSDGTAALLEQYVFTADDGSTWTVLAVDPQYVSIQSSPIVF
jgi:hypothetical protein